MDNFGVPVDGGGADPNMPPSDPNNLGGIPQPINPTDFGANPAQPPVDMSQYQPQPAADPYQPVAASPLSNIEGTPPAVGQPSGGGKGKIIFIVVAIVVAIIFGAGGWFLGYTNGKSAGIAQGRAEEQRRFQESILEDEQSTEEEEATLSLGELVDMKYANEEVTGEVGQQVTTNDGLVVMVSSIERNFTVADANYQLEEGKELVKVNFLLGNIAKERPKDIENVNFRLENSKGLQLTPESIAEYEGKFDAVKIDPGGQAKVSIVYKVDKDEAPLTLTRSQVYRITNQNRETTTKVSIVVADK